MCRRLTFSARMKATTAFLGDSTCPASDFFVKNLVAILAEERIGLAVKRPAALTFGDFGLALKAIRAVPIRAARLLPRPASSLLRWPGGFFGDSRTQSASATPRLSSPSARRRRAGAFLLQEWPRRRRRRKAYGEAIKACNRAIAGEAEPETARQALIAAIEDLSGK